MLSAILPLVLGAVRGGRVVERPIAGFPLGRPRRMRYGAVPR